ncbi:histidinol-phosphate transaminase [Buchnera aphidicola (Rhopalosiphum padi)]|jgi:histidinol-phosphate aminotransferase|uniref:Histidinol-phosphate aminotransferase n=1 Tax=Buchnera aphidicola subsp. Rhopalosiphum padi TaxID=98793 RepID=A0A4D6Y6C3_BUCRP|nr:histidinol-phosphate transaminase [Buchnera aphidicola]QCI24759.1 histidinol-phosphate transaminase [Buchnera aphidicola (Rhopalosiphum padi)]
MTANINKLARKNIQTLNPYQSARRIGGQGDTWLNANESPISVSFKARIECFNRYPECQPNDLVSSYANYVGLSNSQILVTRGADEGIELLIKAFCKPGEDAIIYCPPTYDMYAINAKIADVAIKEIPTFKNTWQIDLFNINLNLEKVKLIYICNPNNPTGNIISKRDLKSLLKITLGRSLVVIDEAYIEFSPKNSMVNSLKEFPNLIILRTLSKAFALAGIRCGFTLATEEVINILNTVISPYPISTIVTDIAVQSLEKKAIEDMRNRVLTLNMNRIWLVDELKKISYVKKVFDSHANYILVKFYMFEKIFQSLWEKGIILRNQDHKNNLKNCLRISIGSNAECIHLVKELKNLSKI